MATFPHRPLSGSEVQPWNSDLNGVSFSGGAAYDTSVKYNGTRSLRFPEGGSVQVGQFPVTYGKTYVLTYRQRGQNYPSASIRNRGRVFPSGANFNIAPVGAVSAAGEWQEMITVFCPRQGETSFLVRLERQEDQITSQGSAGNVWIDDIRAIEIPNTTWAFGSTAPVANRTPFNGTHVRVSDTGDWSVNNGAGSFTPIVPIIAHPDYNDYGNIGEYKDQGFNCVTQINSISVCETAANAGLYYFCDFTFYSNPARSGYKSLSTVTSILNDHLNSSAFSKCIGVYVDLENGGEDEYDLNVQLFQTIKNYWGNSRPIWVNDHGVNRHRIYAEMGADVVGCYINPWTNPNSGMESFVQGQIESALSSIGQPYNSLPIGPMVANLPHEGNSLANDIMGSFIAGAKAFSLFADRPHWGSRLSFAGSPWFGSINSITDYFYSIRELINTPPWSSWEVTANVANNEDGVLFSGRDLPDGRKGLLVTNYSSSSRNVTFTLEPGTATGDVTDFATGNTLTTISGDQFSLSISGGSVAAVVFGGATYTAPVFSGGSPGSVSIGQTATLTYTIQPNDGSSFSVQMVPQSGLAYSDQSLNTAVNPHVFTVDVVASQGGTYQVQAECVVDGNSGSPLTATTQLSVSSNSISINPFSTLNSTPYQSVSLQLTATSDNGLASFSRVGGESWLSVSTGGLVTGIVPGGTRAGTYGLQVQANDTQGSYSAVAEVSVVVGSDGVITPGSWSVIDTTLLTSAAAGSGGGYWAQNTSHGGYTGAGYLIALPAGTDDGGIGAGGVANFYGQCPDDMTLWVRAQTSSSTDTRFYVTTGDGDQAALDVPAASATGTNADWYWVNSGLTLEAGMNTFTLVTGDGGVRIDKILLAEGALIPNGPTGFAGGTLHDFFNAVLTAEVENHQVQQSYDTGVTITHVGQKTTTITTPGTGGGNVLDDVYGHYLYVSGSGDQASQESGTLSMLNSNISSNPYNPSSSTRPGWRGYLFKQRWDWYDSGSSDSWLEGLYSAADAAGVYLQCYFIDINFGLQRTDDTKSNFARPDRSFAPTWIEASGGSCVSGNPSNLAASAKLHDATIMGYFISALKNFHDTYKHHPSYRGIMVPETARSEFTASATVSNLANNSNYTNIAQPYSVQYKRMIDEVAPYMAPYILNCQFNYLVGSTDYLPALVSHAVSNHPNVELGTPDSVWHLDPQNPDHGSKTVGFYDIIRQYRGTALISPDVETREMPLDPQSTFDMFFNEGPTVSWFPNCIYWYGWHPDAGSSYLTTIKNMLNAEDWEINSTPPSNVSSGGSGSTTETIVEGNNSALLNVASSGTRLLMTPKAGQTTGASETFSFWSNDTQYEISPTLVEPQVIGASVAVLSTPAQTDYWVDREFFFDVEYQNAFNLEYGVNIGADVTLTSPSGQTISPNTRKILYLSDASYGNFIQVYSATLSEPGVYDVDARVFTFNQGTGNEESAEASFQFNLYDPALAGTGDGTSTTTETTVIPYAGDGVRIDEDFVSHDLDLSYVSGSGSPSWSVETAIAGYSGAGYLQSVGSHYTAEDKLGQYITIDVSSLPAGNHYLWLRYYSLDVNDDSAFFANNDGPPSAVYFGTRNEWKWYNYPWQSTITNAINTVKIWIREPNFKIDKVVIVPESVFATPTGADGFGNDTTETTTVGGSGGAAGVVFVDLNDKSLVNGSGTSTWSVNTAIPGYSGSGYLQAAGNNTSGTGVGEYIRLDVASLLPGGADTSTYRMYLRYYTENGDDESCYFSINGGAHDDNYFGTKSAWTWGRYPFGANLAAGTSTIDIYVREQNFRLDKILLVPDSVTAEPSGAEGYDQVSVGPGPVHVGMMTSRGGVAEVFPYDPDSTGTESRIFSVFATGDLNADFTVGASEYFNESVDLPNGAVTLTYEAKVDENEHQFRLQLDLDALDNTYLGLHRFTATITTVEATPRSATVPMEVLVGSGDVGVGIPITVPINSVNNPISLSSSVAALGFDNTYFTTAPEASSISTAQGGSAQRIGPFDYLYTPQAGYTGIDYIDLHATSPRPNDKDYAPLIITVSESPQLTFVNPGTVEVDVGVFVDLQLQISGVEGTLSVTTTDTLPPGLSVSSDGYIIGTPTVAGDYNVTVTATDDSESVSQTFTVTARQASITNVQIGVNSISAVYSGSVDVTRIMYGDIQIFP